jgi:Protein of unknown function (DUF3618)
VSTAKDPEQIREEIEETRQELGDTVEALAAKADVKAQVHRQVESTKASVQRNPAPLAAAGVLVAAFLVWRLRKKN